MKRAASMIQAGVVALFLFGANAQADDQKKDRFQELDTDGNGFLSLDEFMAAGFMSADYANQRFENLDKNRDGKLSKAEAMAGPKRK